MAPWWVMAAGQYCQAGMYCAWYLHVRSYAAQRYEPWSMAATVQ
jgi:hypothetical protein